MQKATAIHAGTYNSNPVVIAAGLATVRHLKENRETLYARLYQLGDHLRDGFRKSFKKAGLPALIGGLGPVVQVTLTETAVLHADIYFNEQNFDIVEKLRRKSERCDVSMVRLAMGWVLQKESITSVLVGATDVHHLENAVAALEMPFPPEWIDEMDAWGAGSAGSGDSTQTKANRS